MKLFESFKLTEKPLIKVNKWLMEAVHLDAPLPHAMNLSTVDESGQPSSRMVLLKEISDEGLVFYTDYLSQKGQALDFNPKASLNFWWPKLDKQIRLEGICRKTSKKESDDYFFSRPRGSQVSAIISTQSKVISTYEELLEKVKNLEKTPDHDLQRPKRWGGYRLKPFKIEFWKNEPNRLHKRELFISENNHWVRKLLSP